MIPVDISIILPVYNAEKTIKRSINSVLRQENVNYEILCIDDGSTDTSAEQIKMLQKDHPQILLLEQDHNGSGPARNTGIMEAKGKYIAFLDADDEFVDRKALSIMFNACTKFHADICGSLRVIFEDGEEHNAELFNDFQIPENGCFIEFDDFQYDFDYQSFIFDRNFLIDNDIFFPSYMRYQDPPFFLKAMSTAEQFYVVPIILYKYNCNFDLQKQRVVIKYVNHILQGMRETLELSKNKGYRKLFREIIQRIDSTFHDAILQNLSDETMSLLLVINDISQEFQGKRLQILSDIYISPCNMEKLAYSHYLMNQIVMIKQHEGGFQKYFVQQNIHSAAVYGLGVYGKILINELKICGVKVICGVDREVSAYENLPVIQPDDGLPECDALIISLMEPEDVVRYYEKNENIRIYAFTWIIQKITEELRENASVR